MIHHKSWFPLVVIGLSALLGVFIYFNFKDRLVTVTQSPVTAIEYQAQVHTTVSILRASLAAAASDADRVVLLASDRDALLGLLVPGSYKDAHLEMVMTINEWILGYQGDTGKKAAAEERWQTLVNQYPWIE